MSSHEKSPFELMDTTLWWVSGFFLPGKSPTKRLLLATCPQICFDLWRGSRVGNYSNWNYRSSARQLIRRRSTVVRAKCWCWRPFVVETPTLMHPKLFQITHHRPPRRSRRLIKCPAEMKVAKCEAAMIYLQNLKQHNKMWGFLQNFAFKY